NPDILYAEWQQGNLNRIDLTTGETVYIQPQPAPGDPPERFNWDSPILVSPHQPTRLYYASQRVWRSDDRGDSWTAVSGDLTRDQKRVDLPLMGQTWGWDAPWDIYAMSMYNTITSLAESPLVEGLLYAGTDDGMIAVSEDGGGNWRRLEVGRLPGVPERAFVNDIRADLHDPDTVYVALDNHKYGDFSPYLLVSRDRGRSWKSIAGDLPEKHLVWRLVQDHVRPELLFAATEFGAFFTIDAGKRWHELDGNMPTIPLRDIQIQRRENDLVAASFGRGFFVLDDYTPLREVTPAMLEAEATLFTPRDADWYHPRGVLGSTRRGSQGDALYVADNPPFGAVLTYHLAEGFETREAARQAGEQARREAGKAITFPAWEAIEAERREAAPALELVIRDADDAVIRRVPAPVEKGFHRVAWDLRHPFSGAIETPDNWQGQPPKGFLVEPGTYSAELVLQHDGRRRALAGPVSFAVERLYEGALEGAPMAEVSAFWQDVAAVEGRLSAARYALDDAVEAVEALQTALAKTPEAPGELDGKLHDLRQRLYDLDRGLNGHRSKQAIGANEVHRVGNWLAHAKMGVSGSSYGPTPAHRQSLGYAREALAPLAEQLNGILERELPALRAALREAGAPWSMGQVVPAGE
ncbi:MAG TPA: glycosyl hydrolase, partial [Pseudohaliea sp.]|nr:glycosyl hydrolase [Pseudohaliea sp.]